MRRFLVVKKIGKAKYERTASAVVFNDGKVVYQSKGGVISLHENSESIKDVLDAVENHWLVFVDDDHESEDLKEVAPWLYEIEE